MPAPPAPGSSIGNSIFREPVFSYATMPRFDLSERRAITSSFNSAQMEVQVALNDLAQFGLYKPTVS